MYFFRLRHAAEITLGSYMRHAAEITIPRAVPICGTPQRSPYYARSLGTPQRSQYYERTVRSCVPRGSRPDRIWHCDRYWRAAGRCRDDRVPETLYESHGMNHYVVLGSSTRGPDHLAPTVWRAHNIASSNRDATAFAAFPFAGS